MRIRTSLFSLALGVVAPLVIFCAVAGWLLIERESTSLSNTALARNRATLAAVDAKIVSAIDALRALSASASLKKGDLQAFHADASAVLSTQPSWQNVVLSRPDGGQLVNARLAWGEPLLQQLVERESFQKAVVTAQPAVGGISFAPRLNGEPGIAVRLPIVRGGKVEFVLTAVLRLATFQQVLADQKLPADLASGIVSTDGRIVARVPPVPVGATASKDYQTHTAGARDGWYRGKTLEGSDTFTAFSRSDLTGWSIGYAIPFRQKL